MELKAKKQKCMLLQNEVNVKFEVQTPYKKKSRQMQSILNL